jgi:hypothetical protein
MLPPVGLIRADRTAFALVAAYLRGDLETLDAWSMTMMRVSCWSW